MVYSRALLPAEGRAGAESLWLEPTWGGSQGQLSGLGRAGPHVCARPSLSEKQWKCVRGREGA